MESEEQIWQLIENDNDQYLRLRLHENIDYMKFYMYSLVTHSTAIEGSTLTEFETQLLFDEGLTAKGKPLVEHLMNEDLKNAYVFSMGEAKRKRAIDTDFLQNLNSIVMKSTGGLNNTIGGVFDTSKGDYRLCGVQAGYGGKSYLNYTKIPEMVNEFCDEINRRMFSAESLQDIYTLSFDAHLNLVTIHPWLDGNGRTARLLMNYIQFFHEIAPTKIFKDDRSEYIVSLRNSQDNSDNKPFRNFMVQQHLKTLHEEISNHKKDQQKGFSLIF